MWAKRNVILWFVCLNTWEFPEVRAIIIVRSLLIYKFTRSSCNSAYAGKTKRHFGVRMFEHLGISLSSVNNYCTFLINL